MFCSIRKVGNMFRLEFIDGGTMLFNSYNEVIKFLRG